MTIERGHQNISFTPNEILSLFKKAFPHCNSIDSWHYLTGGALNTVIKIEFNQKTYVLKIYVNDKYACRREIEINSIIQNNVTTPKIIYLNESDYNFSYTISEFVPGIRLDDVSPSHSISLSHKIGTLLARIHAYTFSQAGLFGNGLVITTPFLAGSSPYYEEVHRLLTQDLNICARLGDELTVQTLEFIETHKDLFPKIENNICLTHSDFKPVNLVYTSSDDLYVFDWEFAHAGIGLLDIAILLRYRKQFPLNISMLEIGYKEAGGVLPSDYKRSAMITDFVNILSMMSQPSERPLLFEEIKNILKTTIRDLDGQN